MLERAWSDSDNYASVHVWDCENQARLRICEGFFGYSPEEQREWLTHELMHVTLDRPHRVVDQLSDHLGSEAVYQFARQAHENETEICVQRLARILAPMLPLPPDMGK